MFYFDKEDDRVLFCDIRDEEHIVTDSSSPGGERTVRIHPDVVADFRDLPFDDGAFSLVIFDPPHLKHAGKNSWLAKKYGTLPEIGWKEYLQHGLHECWRVLRQHGTLIFKWNEEQMRLGDLVDIFPDRPVMGQRRGKTIFVVFFKSRSKKH